MLTEISWRFGPKLSAIVDHEIIILQPNKSNEKSNEGNDGEDGDEADDEDEDETPDDSAKS